MISEEIKHKLFFSSDYEHSVYLQEYFPYAKIHKNLRLIEKKKKFFNQYYYM